MIILMLQSLPVIHLLWLFPPYYSRHCPLPLILSIVQLGSSAAYRVGQAVRLQRRLWWGGSLGAPEQWCPAGRGEEEQQEATFLHFSDDVPQTHASSPAPAPLHGNKRTSPYQLEQSHSSCPNRGDQWGAFLQCTFTGKICYRQRERMK